MAFYENEICGKCKWHKAEPNGYGKQKWYCDNEESDAYDSYTDYSEHCEEWEERV